MLLSEKRLRTERPVWRLNRCPLFLRGSWPGSEPGWILPNDTKPNSPTSKRHTPGWHIHRHTHMTTCTLERKDCQSHTFGNEQINMHMCTEMQTNTRAEAPPHTPTHTHTHTQIKLLNTAGLGFKPTAPHHHAQHLLFDDVLIFWPLKLTGLHHLAHKLITSWVITSVKEQFHCTLCLAKSH